MKNLLAKSVYYTRTLDIDWTAKLNDLVRDKIDSGQVAIYQNVSRLGKQTQTQVYIFSIKVVYISIKNSHQSAPSGQKPILSVMIKKYVVKIEFPRLGFLETMFDFIRMEHWYHEI